MQLERSKHHQAEADVANPRVEHSQRDQIFEQMRADKFGNMLLAIMDIYAEISEPFIPINPEITERVQGEQSSPPSWLPPEFQDKIKAAGQAAARIINAGSWAKAGIPPSSIWELLGIIFPYKKVFIAVTDRAHRHLVTVIESQRERCYQMSRLASPEAGLIAVSANVRADIFNASIQGVETCTRALSKLEKATAIINDAKREWLDARSRSRREVEQKLVELRRKYVKEETHSAMARNVVQLLNAWDPATKWNANSLRVGRVYQKRSQRSPALL